MRLTQKFDEKLKHLIAQMPGASGCKDRNSRYICANQSYTSLMGLKHSDDIIGLTDYNLPCDAVKCAGLFIAQDQHVINAATSLKILDIHPFAGNQWKIYIFTKTPLKNENNEIIGVLFQGIDITNLNKTKIGMLLTNKELPPEKGNLAIQDNFCINNQYSKIHLTERQSQVLFFLLRGKTVKQVALILGLSSRTIDDYLEQLRLKFTVRNRHELIDKAISHGFLNVTPESLFRKQISVTLEE